MTERPTGDEQPTGAEGQPASDQSLSSVAEGAPSTEVEQPLSVVTQPTLGAGRQLRLELPGLTVAEIDMYAIKGAPQGASFDDPSKFTTREAVVGRQAVVAMKIQLLLERVGGTLNFSTDKKLAAWYVRLYEGLVARDEELEAAGLPYDGAKVVLLGRQ